VGGHVAQLADPFAIASVFATAQNQIPEIYRKEVALSLRAGSVELQMLKITNRKRQVECPLPVSMSDLLAPLARNLGVTGSEW